MRSAHLDAILPSYPLSPDQEEVFRRNGFVVLDNVRYDSFFYAFFELYRQDLPIYISADAILDALHLSFDRMLLTLEETRLIGELGSMLEAMQADIGGLEAHAGGRNIAAELDDVAVWICVARSLLAGEPAACERGVGDRAQGLVELALAEQAARVELFGCVVLEDFSQFRPRGHYTKSPELERYFRAMMWVQRIGMRFVESRRAAAVAFLLTRLVQDTTAAAHWGRIDGAYRLLVGSSDSLNPGGMDRLLGLAGVDSVADFYDPLAYDTFADTAIATRAGQQQINSQILMANPYATDFTPIPPMYHVLGQRFTVDSHVFTNVVFDRVKPPTPFDPKRILPEPLDLAFVLGNAAALPLLEDELRTYRYHPHLAALRDLVDEYPRYFWESSLYNLWTDALRELQADTTGPRYPPVLRTESWDRRMLQTQLASTAQRRRDTILVVKPSYTYGECRYPDAWVDPYPAFFRRLAAFGRAAGSTFAALAFEDRWQEGEDEGGVNWAFQWYFENLSDSCDRLAEIAEAELAGQELSWEQLNFVNSLLTTFQGCTAAKFDGWFVRMIYRVKNGEGEPFEPVIADIHTGPLEDPKVLHVATGHPNALLLSVETACGPQAYIGPVLSYYELVTEGFQRLNDEEWKEFLETRGPPERPVWAYDFVR
jgi:hypothetical protein